ADPAERPLRNKPFLAGELRQTPRSPTGAFAIDTVTKGKGPGNCAPGPFSGLARQKPDEKVRNHWRGGIG
ncbi:hypothetical protein, partial [Escherichia coli]|uniref:hypothetical protein n=1 Tax=Escherichia coli TaxID=562 RepID=UPI001952F508